jgi:hypothetical protein
MISAAVRSDPSAKQWSRIVSRLVGDKKAITISDFEAAVLKIQEADGIQTTHVRARIYDRLKDDPSKAAAPDAAWEEAEALHAVAPWCSGLLALLAAGHYSEATGVIGMSTPSLTCERMLRMLERFEDAIYLSPFDAFLGPTAESEFIPADIKRFVELKAVDARTDNNEEIVGENALIAYSQQEAARLQRRNTARRTWSLSDDVRDAFIIGRTTWQKKRTSANALTGLLKYAALVARDATLTASERKHLWRFHLTRWICMHTGGDDTMSLLQVYDLMANPRSAFARELRVVLQFSSRGKDPMSQLAHKALHDLKGVQLHHGALAEFL